jgi:hypothetical protein
MVRSCPAVIGLVASLVSPPVADAQSIARSSIGRPIPFSRDGRPPSTGRSGGAASNIDTAVTREPTLRRAGSRRRSSSIGLSSRVWQVHRMRVSCAFVLVVSSVGLAAGQPAPAGALSEALRTHVRAEQFDIVTSIRGLPLGVRNELQTMWRSQTLDIADPGAEYQGTVANRTLPSRRLVAAGCSADRRIRG